MIIVLIIYKKKKKKNTNINIFDELWPVGTKFVDKFLVQLCLWKLLAPVL